MSVAEPQRERLQRELEAQRGRLAGSTDVWRRRREALEVFAAEGFPTRRDEAWHYTDLKPIAAGDFDFAGAALEAPRAEQRAALERLLAEAAAGRTTPRAVFVDGRLDAELSCSVPANGLEVVGLAKDPTRFAAALEHRSALDSRPLAALNAAFAQDGVAIRVAAGHAAPEPLSLCFLSGGQRGLAAQPRVSIELGAGASLTIVVHCLDAPAAEQPAAEHAGRQPAPDGAAPARGPAGWLNVVTEVSLAEGARLSIYRLQEHGPEFFETSLLAAEVGKDAALEVGYVDLGGRLVRNDIDVRLLEPGARATLFGVFVAGAGQHIDDHTKIEHAAPSTTSDETFRGIADRDGHGVFSGKVIVHPGAQHIDARQSSDNLLLAERAEIDARPQLEIYADDVKCSHGATVGELDEEQLFYLRARGIDEAAARALLTFAFANTVLARLAPPALRERARAGIAGQLPGGAPGESFG